MSSPSPEDMNKSRDPDLIGAEAAMHRAAIRAQRRAEKVARTSAGVRQDGTGGVTRGSLSETIAHDPKALTFSEAQGYEELPGALKLEELPSQARIRIWNLLDEVIRRDTETDVAFGERYFRPRSSWRKILQDLHRDHHVRPLDEWHADPSARALQQDIQSLPLNQVFDLIQFVLHHSRCVSSLVPEMKRVFADSRLAYTIDEGPPPTILPAVTSEEGTMLVESMQTLRHGGMEGSVSHLHKASACISLRDWAGSIRESIHAVESVARRLDPRASSLGKALKTLERDRALHPALGDGFDKLYGYTSDERGIRHALIEDTDANVGMDEAVFMFGACASFASYLWRKHNSKSS